MNDITEVDRLNAEIADLKRTIEWYQGRTGIIMGAAARAGIVGAPAAPEWKGDPYCWFHEPSTTVHRTSFAPTGDCFALYTEQQVQERIAAIASGPVLAWAVFGATGNLYQIVYSEISAKHHALESNGRYAPMGEIVAHASVPAEPTAPHILEALSYHANERDDLTLEDAVKVLRFGWRTVSGRTERAMLMQIIDLLASAPTDTGAIPVEQVEKPK